MATVTKIDSPRYRVELNDDEAQLVLEALLSIETGDSVEALADGIIEALNEGDVVLTKLRLEGVLTAVGDAEEECE